MAACAIFDEPQVKLMNQRTRLASTLALMSVVAWKKDGRLGWQVYDKRGRPSGRIGSAANSGNGAAGVVTKEGRFILFR
jgi:hypothetical protein